MALYFAVTLFVSAFLLFLVQPMVGKMVLPLVGGAPAVWATCLVFFQALLLAGYSYAHAATRRLGSRRQSVFHLTVLALPLAAFGVSAVLSGGSPIHAFRSLAPTGGVFPFFGMMLLLAAAIGLPFFVVATSAPLLQRWFADTNDPTARDPYFLYAASNLGSLLALIAYPAVIEPRFHLATQSWLWAGGYAALVMLTAGCAARLRASPPPPVLPTTKRPDATPPRPAQGKKGDRPAPAKAVDAPPTWLQKLHWVALAMVPTSLLLGVTNFLTTDITPMPMLWVIPLALYLLTFIIAFGRPPFWLQKAVELVTPVAVLILLFTTVGKKPDWGLVWIALMHLVTFFLVALNCHMELARRRPAAKWLTEFYLWVSVGGVLGGLFNALVAPLVCKHLEEYPLALIAGCLLQPAGEGEKNNRVSWLLDLAIPLIVGVMTWALLKAQTHWQPTMEDYVHFPIPAISFLKYGGGPFIVARDTLWAYLVFGPPMLLAYFWVERPLRFGLAIGAIWLVAGVISPQEEREIYRDRSFFGVLSVTTERDRDSADQPLLFHKLVHGSTVHGKQQYDPLSDEPMTYYHRTGPIGRVFAEHLPAIAKGDLAFVGLGSGTMAAYAEPGQHVTFYEIDPAMRRLAENPNNFTFLRDCKGQHEIVMGDARLKMEEYGKEHQYGIIVVDAFSSDAIPVHLLTKEAVALYRSRLAPGGLIALHVSNRYLLLTPVAARIAQELGMVGITIWDPWEYNYRVRDTQRYQPGKLSSEWIFLAEKREDFGKLPNQSYDYEKVEDDNGRTSVTPLTASWEDLRVDPGTPLWTDEFSNLLQIMNWSAILKLRD